MIRKSLFGAILILILILSANFSQCSADRGGIPHEDIDFYEPSQKAILAWNGYEEILILSTNVYGTGNSTVLEILPLPSEPTQLRGGNISSFIEVEKFLQPTSYWWSTGDLTYLRNETGGVEIIFHEIIGAHNITVVKVNVLEDFNNWLDNYMSQKSFTKTPPEKLSSIIDNYIERDMRYFVFDEINVSSFRKSIEPIVYRFKTSYLYYPLLISSLASGITEIKLYIIVPDDFEKVSLTIREMGGFGFENYPRKDAIAVILLERNQTVNIGSEIAEFFADKCYLIAFRGEWNAESLDEDIVINAEIKQEIDKLTPWQIFTIVFWALCLFALLLAFLSAYVYVKIKKIYEYKRRKHL